MRLFLRLAAIASWRAPAAGVAPRLGNGEIGCGGGRVVQHKSPGRNGQLRSTQHELSNLESFRSNWRSVHVPVPARLTVCGLPPPLSLTLSIAFLVPLAFGVNATLIVHLAPAS